MADDLGRDTFVAGLRHKELWKLVHQALQAALQGEACFRAEEDQGAVWAVTTQPLRNVDNLPKILEWILACLEAGTGSSPPRQRLDDSGAEG